MQYYSSMTMADYFQANWQELPPELVALYEREWKDLESLEGQVMSWQDSYHAVRDDAERFSKSIEDAIDEYTFGHGDASTMIVEIRDLCKHADFHEAWHD